MIRRAAFRYGLAGPELDEVVQDIRIRLWRALDRPGEKKPAENASYVYRMAMSAALDGVGFAATAGSCSVVVGEADLLKPVLQLRRRNLARGEKEVDRSSHLLLYD